MADLLNIAANEKVYLEDIQFLANEAAESERDFLGNFGTNSSNYRAWLLSGFEITTASTEITVTLGKAILSSRQPAEIKHGNFSF